MWLSLLIVYSIIALLVGRLIFRISLKRHGEMCKRYKAYYDLLNRWLKNKNAGKIASDYLKRKGISSIAIYGMGEVGWRFFEDLKDTYISIKYCVDNNAKALSFSTTGVPLIQPDKIKHQDNVDAIIVTAIYDFNSIEDLLVDYQIESIFLSVEDIIYER